MNTIFKYYKGGYYEYAGECLREEDQKRMILYRSMISPHTQYVCTEDEFYGNAVVDGKSVPRFQGIITDQKIGEVGDHFFRHYSGRTYVLLKQRIDKEDGIETVSLRRVNGNDGFIEVAAEVFYSTKNIDGVETRVFQEIPMEESKLLPDLKARMEDAEGLRLTECKPQKRQYRIQQMTPLRLWIMAVPYFIVLAMWLNMSSYAFFNSLGSIMFLFTIVHGVCNSLVSMFFVDWETRKMTEDEFEANKAQHKKYDHLFVGINSLTITGGILLLTVVVSDGYIIMPFWLLAHVLISGFFCFMGHMQFHGGSYSESEDGEGHKKSDGIFIPVQTMKPNRSIPKQRIPTVSRTTSFLGAAIGARDSDNDTDHHDDPDDIPYDGISAKPCSSRSEGSFLDRVGADNAPWEKHMRDDHKYHASICQHDDPYDCDDENCY